MARTSRCFSRSIAALRRAVKLFVYAWATCRQGPLRLEGELREETIAIGQIAIRQAHHRQYEQAQRCEQKRQRAARRALVRALADTPLTVSALALLRWLAWLVGGAP